MLFDGCDCPPVTTAAVFGWVGPTLVVVPETVCEKLVVVAASLVVVVVAASLVVVVVAASLVVVVVADWLVVVADWLVVVEEDDVVVVVVSPGQPWLRVSTALPSDGPS